VFNSLHAVATLMLIGRNKFAISCNNRFHRKSII